MSEITLEFLAARQERLLEEMAQVRDDVRVMAAIVQRLDGTVQGLTSEVRASHARFDRLAAAGRAVGDGRGRIVFLRQRSTPRLPAMVFLIQFQL